MAKYGSFDASKMSREEEGAVDTKAESTRNLMKTQKPINPSTKGFMGSKGRTSKLDQFTRPSRANKILY